MLPSLDLKYGARHQNLFPHRAAWHTGFKKPALPTDFCIVRNFWFSERPCQAMKPTSLLFMPKYAAGSALAMSRAPSADGRQDRRRSSSCARSALPSRRSSSALEEYPQQAVTRAIYHHARAYLAIASIAAGSAKPTPREKCRRAACAIRQAARAVILESTVVQIILRCVEQTKQRQAREADEMWRKLSGDVRFLFGGQKDIDSVTKIAGTLAEMLSGFDGGDDVRNRFLNVAKSFDNSEVALKQLQASFGNNLEGLHAMRNDFDRFTAEIIRLVGLLEGDCNSMRVQLQKTLKSPRQRVNRNLLGGLENLGKGRMMPDGTNAGEASQDHITTLLSTLEHDLCDTPLAAMVQVAQDVNDQIVKQLSDSGKLQGQDYALNEVSLVPLDEPTSPTKVVTDLLQALRPCIFEAVDAAGAEAGADVGTRSKVTGPRKASKGVEQQPLRPERVVVSPSSPVRPPVDVLYARAQLARDSAGLQTAQTGSGSSGVPESSKSALVPLGLLSNSEAVPSVPERGLGQRLPKLKPLPHTAMDFEQGCPTKPLSNRSVKSASKESLQEPMATSMVPPVPGFVEHSEHADYVLPSAGTTAVAHRGGGDSQQSTAQTADSRKHSASGSGGVGQSSGPQNPCIESEARESHEDTAGALASGSRWPEENCRPSDDMTAGPRAPRCRTPDDLSCEYLRTSTSRENQKLSPTSRSQSQPNLQATSRSLEDRDRNPEPIRLPGLPDLRRDHLRACAAQATAGASFDEASEATETTYLANSEAATASKENRASTGMDSQGKDGQDGRRSASLPLDSAPRRFRHSGHSGFPGRAQEPAEFSRFIASEQTGRA